ncbi:MAG: type II secretion system protein GspD [Selenomonadaceae bacterium]|nr:type II secretion system protein GspD [Selenomonadaceae bacterium]
MLLWGLIFFSGHAALASPVTLKVVDGDVRGVLLSTARLGNLNLVLDDSVQGTITINLVEVEPIDALRLVAAAKNLALDEREGALVVADGRAAGLNRLHVFPLRYGNPNVLREAALLALQPALSRNMATNNAGGTGRKISTAATTVTIVEKNADATTRSTDTASTKSISPYEGNGLEREAERIFVDPNTNSLLLYGTAAEAETLGQMLSKLDVPAKQVALEAKVVALSKDASKKLGVDWSWSSLPQYPEVDTTYESRRRAITNSDGTTSIVTEDVPKREVRRSYNNGNIPGIIQFGHGPEGQPFEFYYEATISAMVTKGEAKILARPNITTIQGQEAVINIGGEIPVPKVSTTNSATTTAIDYKEAGIILRCTPRVNDEGQITSLIHTEVSSPVYVEELKAYRLQKRAADTTVRLRDGETMVIGGLIGSEEYRSVSKVPFLGDIPILGAFFKSVRNSKTDSEVMIFLTARVIK